MALRSVTSSVLFAVLGVAPPWAGCARAALDGDAASVESDAAELHGVVTTELRQQYDVQEIRAETGMRVREYLTRDGIVFAVSWSGPVTAGSAAASGQLFRRVQLPALKALPHPGLHRSVRSASPDLIVESGGHLRAYAGRAYLAGSPSDGRLGGGDPLVMVPRRDSLRSIRFARPLAGGGPAQRLCRRQRHLGGERRCRRRRRIRSRSRRCRPAGAPGGAPVGAINHAYVTVKVCAPGSQTECASIDHVLLDTGSVGLRLVRSVLAAHAVTLAAETDAQGRAVEECVSFAGGQTWGPVALADVYDGRGKRGQIAGAGHG